MIEVLGIKLGNRFGDGMAYVAASILGAAA